MYSAPEVTARKILQNCRRSAYRIAMGVAGLFRHLRTPMLLSERKIDDES